jgi:hypothetical protein
MRCLYLMLLPLLISSAAVLGAENLIPNPSFEKLDDAGWAATWGRYNWGMESSEGST